jgi:NAD-dependent SIR2 family protein deacetylase
LSPAARVDQIQAMDAALRELASRRGGSVAVFLGAGASKSFGYPLTRDLMLQIFKGLLQNEILGREAAGMGTAKTSPRQELLDFLVELLPGERYSENLLPQVTAVLSLLDFSLATGQALLPGRTMDDTRRARRLLERAILETIPDHEWFEPAEEARFDLFARWLGCLKSRGSRGGLSLITSNYDMISDLAALYVARARWSDGQWSLNSVARKVDFGFRWVHPEWDDETIFDRPPQPEVALLKLHGSTNWLRCPLCENVYINPAGPIAWLAGRKKTAWTNECHCSETQLEPQIISPSFVREMREPNLIAVWKHALERLRAARHWVIIGYSFPDEDVGIRALFARASSARDPKPRITVVQRDEKARVNYESFFEQGTVNYLTGGMDLLLDRWKARTARLCPGGKS